MDTNATAAPAVLPGAGVRPFVRFRPQASSGRRAFRRLNPANPGSAPRRAVEVVRYDNDELPTAPVRVPVVGNLELDVIISRTTRPAAGDPAVAPLKGVVVVRAPTESIPVAADFVFLADVSMSMEGGKLETLQAILRWIASPDGASENDRVSLVAFSDESELILPLTFMTEAGKAELRRVAKNLRTVAGTRISSALDTAADILSDRRYVSPVTSVVLLSDGQDPQAESEGHAALVAIGQGATLRSIGVGADHDPAMLKGLSDLAHGDFAVALDGKTLADAMGCAVGAARSTVASSLSSLQLWRKVDENADNERPIITMENFGTMSAGEMRYYPFTCTDEPTQLEAHVTYLKPGSDATQSVGYGIEIFEGDCAPASEEALKLIEQHELRVAVARALETAAKAAQESRLQAADEILDAAIKRVRDSSVADTEMSKGLMADLEASKESCTNAARRRGGRLDNGTLAGMLSAGGRHTTMRASGGAGATAGLYNTPLMAAASQRAVDDTPAADF